jgi:threonine/homoserine/homoserine lactone efflux protein
MSMFSPSPSVLIAFLAVSLTLNVTPGSDMMFVIAQTVSGGIRAGHRAAFGIALGSLIQAMLAITGISALIAASRGLLLALTYAGACYLAWIGARIIQGSHAVQGENGSDPHIDIHPFRRGVITNLLNIKVVLFYVTLLPLFIRSSAGPEWQQVLFYGLLFNFLGTSVLLCVASGVDKAAFRSMSTQGIAVWASRLGGAILIALAIAVLFRQAS